MKHLNCEQQERLNKTLKGFLTLFKSIENKEIDKLKATGEIVNQDIEVTENGTYTADDVYTGIGTVTVNTPYKAILDNINLILAGNNIEPPTDYTELPDVIAMVIQMNGTV